PGRRPPQAGPARARPALPRHRRLLLFGMSELGNQGTADGPRVIAGAAAGIALIAMFLWHASRRGPAALIDVSPFRRRGFATASSTTFMLGVALFGSLIRRSWRQTHAKPAHVGTITLLDRRPGPGH